MSLLVNQDGHKPAFLSNESSNVTRFPAPTQSRPPDIGPNVSAFRAVGSQLVVNSPAVRPATSPLSRSPDTGRRRDSSDQETVSPTPSSTDGDSQPPTPVVPGPPKGKDAFSWPSHSTYDENRQLLGTEEESSERQSSDDEEDKNIWLITKEQLNYYVTQFRSMQANPHGVIPGAQAKEFFEKSRLPIQELRKIWQLSDVTKDGCLSLEEFLTAMHLVVLRRNDIPLPEELPMCLRPLNLKHGVIDRHNKDLYSGHGDFLLEQEAESILDDSKTDGEKSRISLEVDLSPGSQMSSPGDHKPVNFVSSAVSAAKDPNIACPVPLRYSPDSPPYLQSSEEDSPKTISRQPKNKKREVVYEQLWNMEDSGQRLSRHSSSSSDDTDEDAVDALSSSHSNDSRVSGSHGPVSLPYFVEPRQVPNVLSLQKKEGLPPCPPPRPGKSHTRSASLDLNHLNQKTHIPQTLPSVPPRSSPFQKAPESNTDDCEDILNRDTKEISASIHKLKEGIALLTRTVTELGQEVSDTLEERVVLEYQLEQLKSIGNDDY